MDRLGTDKGTGTGTAKGPVVRGFQLDPRIDASSHWICDQPLSQVRLQDDARFPWVVLVPRRSGVIELCDLNPTDQAQLLAEINTAAVAVRALADHWERPVEKLNIANLGNVTPQLHWHVLGRRADDPCWPGPVWGQGEAISLTSAQVEAAMDVLRGAFSKG